MPEPPSAARDALVLAGAAAAAYAVVFGLSAGGLALSTWVLPALLAAPAALVLFRHLRAGNRSGALAAMSIWALAMVVIGTLAMAALPEAAAATVWNAAPYRDQMMSWVVTGEGTEGDPRAFLPVHLARLALFVPLALASAGALGLVMGAAMVNYMDFFVASYAGAAGGVTALLAWFPWALCRVMAFVVLGVLAAEPLVRRFRTGSWSRFSPGTRRLAATAAAWLLFDALLVVPFLGPLLRDALTGFEDLPSRLWMVPGLLLRVAAVFVLVVITVGALRRRPVAPVLPPTAPRGRLLAAALLLLGVDAVLKAALAPMWGRHLAGFLP